MSEPSLNSNPDDEQKDWYWMEFGPTYLVDDSYANPFVMIADGSQTDAVE